jgi:hypothetical protein
LNGTSLMFSALSGASETTNNATAISGHVLRWGHDASLRATRATGG